MIKYLIVQYLLLALIFSIGIVPSRSLTVRQKLFYVGFWPALCWRGLKLIVREWRLALNPPTERKAGK